ncbi:MAG TPA: hypothetical protein VF898_10445 [Chloroflexota bacterium]
MSAYVYLEHLNEADLALLAAAECDSVDGLLSRLRATPGLLEGILSRPTLYQMLFGAGPEEALLRSSAFLAFAVMVHRAAHDLTRAPLVHEWIGPGRRVPMFEVVPIRDFASDLGRRLFLAELLASYTHVASGSMWIRTDRGWHRRRFSELDPLRLIELLDVVPEGERPAVYRRLGDLALFLTGVFPDYAGGRVLPLRQRRRLQHFLPPASTEPKTLDDISLLEEVGRRAYLTAGRAAEAYGAPSDLVHLAQEFGYARRMLNFLTDSYLFPVRTRWFPMGDG